VVTPDNIHCLDYAAPALHIIANDIIGRCTTLPDLAGVHIVVREPNIAPYLRRALLSAAADKHHDALLGVNISTINSWLAQFNPTELNICSEQTRLLILVDALMAAPDLLGQANPWNLAESLLSLFDELTLNQIDIDSDIDVFQQRLASLYQIPNDNPAGLQQEARLIHQLWHAWHTQLQAQQLTDPVTAQLIAMQSSLTQAEQLQQLHLIGIEPMYLAQESWTQQLLTLPNVHLWLQGIPDTGHENALTNSYLNRLHDRLQFRCNQQPDRSDYHQLLTTVFDIDTPLNERAQRHVQQHPDSAIAGRIHIYSARNTEQETGAIDIQIRKWLLEGKRSIAVVTENRLLARRLRAVLERADIQLQDVVGWALSTTRAAATLEALLICLEQDFPKEALLDLLKSPLFLTDNEHEQYQNLIYRLEHDIIRNEQVARSLSQYKNAITRRAADLQAVWKISPAALLALLDRLDTATQPLRKLQNRKNDIAVYIHELLLALDKLGMLDSLGNDAAGHQIVQILHDMQEAAKQQTLKSYWSGMRAWLGRNLERHYFQPRQTGSPVQLLSLAQTEFQAFDAIILAGMEQDYFPGNMPNMPFFNSAVRKQLHLPDTELFRAARLRHFHRLLFTANQVLLTCRTEQDSQVIIPSPWLSALISFHELAYHDNLQDNLLADLVNSTHAMVFRCDTSELPAMQLQPHPALPADKIPDTYSATSYQQLVDCPYQFYAAQVLKLSPPEEIREVLGKREYGERLHQCLQAFHSDVPNMPGPVQQPVTAENRQQSIELLQQIAQRIFDQDLRDNYLHRGWYHRWLEVISDYIDWQIEQNKSTQVHRTELKLERELNEHVRIKGRIDRIDVANDGTTRQTIIDYKTGNLPTKNEIFAAEKVQLPFYAALSEDDIQEVFYLPIGKRGEVKRQFPVTEQGLVSLKHDTEKRLLDIVEQMRTGQSLPAWENQDVCEYCSMISLCRCGTWQ